jgi:hypothetical protein
MGFGSMISLVMTLLAIVSVFIFIPLISEWAFWILVAAWTAAHGVGDERSVAFEYPGAGVAGPDPYA